MKESLAYFANVLGFKPNPIKANERAIVVVSCPAKKKVTNSSISSSMSNDSFVDTLIIIR